MKTLLAALLSAAMLFVCAFVQGAAPESPAANLKAQVLSLTWTQCAGRFHYTFVTDGTFILDSTLLAGTWNVEGGGELVLHWSGNWIVDHLKFDPAHKQFLHSKGEAFNLLGSPDSTSLATR